MSSEHPFATRVGAVLSARTRVRHGDPQRKPAAVLVALFAASGATAPSVWLMRRAAEMRVHAGQVALPGGQRDARDDGLLDTALREAEEEIALPRELVRVLGALDDCTTVTGFVITPYVGWVPSTFVPESRAGEVARVFAVPLGLFATAPEPLALATPTGKRIVPSYQAEGEVIWGATAAILRRFVDTLSRAP